MSVWATPQTIQRRSVLRCDHAWLDQLDEAHARIFAAEQGYDLVDDEGMLTDWWVIAG